MSTNLWFGALLFIVLWFISVGAVISCLRQLTIEIQENRRWWKINYDDHFPWVRNTIQKLIKCLGYQDPGDGEAFTHAKSIPGKIDNLDKDAKEIVFSLNRIFHVLNSKDMRNFIPDNPGSGGTFTHFDVVNPKDIKQTTEAPKSKSEGVWLPPFDKPKLWTMETTLEQKRHDLKEM